VVSVVLGRSAARLGKRGRRARGDAKGGGVCGSVENGRNVRPSAWLARTEKRGHPALSVWTPAMHLIREGAHSL